MSGGHFGNRTEDAPGLVTLLPPFPMCWDHKCVSACRVSHFCPRKSAHVVLDYNARPKLRKIIGYHHRCQVSVTGQLIITYWHFSGGEELQKRHSFFIDYCDRTVGLIHSKCTKLKALGYFPHLMKWRPLSEMVTAKQHSIMIIFIYLENWDTCSSWVKYETKTQLWKIIESLFGKYR